MGGTHHQATPSARLGTRSGVGEIVEVQGGHIVRSTGRKDRHSKVCTAKGPRDRRVRLSAPTAIQFYDVQDRLGYDRPSKAVDWLIKKAKAAIDELAELPAWNPNTSAIYTNAQQQQQQEHQNQQMNEENESPIGVHCAAVDAIASGSRRTTAPVGSSDGGGRFSEFSVRNLQQQLGENPNSSSSFIPPSLDTDIADTIKSLFPMGAAAETTSSRIHFQDYPPDLLSRTSSQNQDLRLSLHSFQDPILLHQAQHQAQAQAHHHNEQVLFSGTTPLGFDGTTTGWSEHHHPEEQGRLHRMVAWNAGADTGDTDHGGAGGGGGGGFIFNSPSPTTTQLPPPPLQPLFGQSQYLSQRGPLQSSNTPSIRAWIDPSITTATVTDYHHYLPTIHQSSISGIGFASDGFSGFRIPARIQGEEGHDGVSDKPSSASSDSRH